MLDFLSRAVLVEFSIWIAVRPKYSEMIEYLSILQRCLLVDYVIKSRYF